MCTNTQQIDWDEYLPHLTFAYNTSIRNVFPIKTSDACGIRKNALAVRTQAVENIKKKLTKDKERYDEKHRHLEFQVGDKVKVFSPVRKVDRSEKHMLPWFGPYIVKKKIGQVDYEIQKGLTKAAKIDISRILPYIDPWTPVPI
ncbi:hypothetical protein JTB14_009558 [Gonioctena quinquepunctata]|nr:hypothetical protein JTB14_009558 [Gonioctena quinquepunctata]